MKKYILFAIASIAFTACGNSGKTTEATDAVDSLAEQPVNEQSEDHYAIWQMDSTNEVNFVTYDLAAMEVRGHVKKIMYADNGWVARFDEEGNLLKLTDDCSDYTLGHNADGCLTTYACGAGSCDYSIDPETDRLVCYSGGEGSSSWVNWYKYDKAGNLIEIEYNFEDFADETKETRTEKVKVLEKDQHNNWTKRRIGKDITTRTIIYYPNALCDEPDTDESPEFLPLTGGYSFTGTIGSDENCVVTFANGEGTYTVSVGQRILFVDRYDPASGKLVLRAFMKSSGKSIGHFTGIYKDGVYKGVFENYNGGKVNFNLKQQH